MQDVSILSLLSFPAFALPAPATTAAPRPIESTTMMMMMDASYDFGYSGDASSRAESADPAGNVVGTYAYTSPDGNELEVRNLSPYKVTKGLQLVNYPTANASYRNSQNL